MRVVLVLLLVEIVVMFVYLMLFADVGEFPEGPPNRFADTLGYTLLVMMILIVPSVLSGIAYAAILHRRTGGATRRRAVALSPIALAGVWMIVALGVQTVDGVILALAATLLFGFGVPLPDR